MPIVTLTFKSNCLQVMNVSLKVILTILTNDKHSTTDLASPDAVYYDLVLNPERFTGYTGPSAVNVWKLIYDQNCFK